MQTSEEDFDPTPANTPPASDYEEPSREFARLKPSNRLARLAFSQVVELILHDPDVFSHVNKFVRYTEATDEETGSELSDAAEGPRARSPPPRMWAGYYLLDLTIPPLHPPVGWVLGCLSLLGQTDGVDLLLASKHGQYRVGSKHARLTLQRDTGCLLAAVGGRTVSVTGSFGTTKLKNGVRALTEAVGLSIGDLHYDLEYQNLNAQLYRTDLESYMRNELGNPSFELSNSLSSLGASTDIQLKDYTIKETFAAGTSAMVSGAIVKATGQYVAVKKMKRSSREDPTIEIEIDTLERLHKADRHPRICHVKEIITNGPASIGETYIIYEPFLYAELYKVLRAPTLTNEDRLSISTQLMEALSWIHAQGAMHRDLKPQNMGLKTSSPPEAVIFDFGHASFDETSTDHYKGTIWYLAPEVLNIKYRRSTTPYDRAVDVWAMGLSLFELVCHGTKWRGQKTLLDRRGRVADWNMSRMEEVHQELESCRLTGAANVIQDMLEADPRRRIQSYEAWQALLQHGQEYLMESPNSKRLKRSYED